MKNFKLFVLMLATVFCTAELAQAQSSFNPWGFGIGVSKVAYNGDLGNGFFNFDQPNHMAYGARIGRYLNNRWDLVLGGSYGRYGYRDTEDFDPNFLSDMLQFNLAGHFKLRDESKKLRPFLSAGLGYASYSPVDGRGSDESGLHIPLGIGADLRLAEKINLFWHSRYGLAFTDGADAVDVDGNDSYLQHELGFKFNFGNTDRDGDGVKDKVDMCPDTPGLASLDGCPDADGDGIRDLDDECPQVAGLAQFNGCPDADGDGIEDREDDCPQVAGLEQFKGCPDTDGDGLKDGDDNCPEVAGVMALNGCPDADGDGITDAADSCPEVAGLESMNGCPDADGDGVKDSDDKCPNTKGLMSFDGCPDEDGDGIMDSEDKCPSIKGTSGCHGCPGLSDLDRMRLREAQEAISFAPGSKKLNKKAQEAMDTVYDVLIKNPTISLSIGAHTDSKGSDEANMKISQMRADALKAYITEKGMNSSRVSAVGYGESVPLSSNTKDAGWKNRRIEIVSRCY